MPTIPHPVEPAPQIQQPQPQPTPPQIQLELPTVGEIVEALKNDPEFLHSVTGRDGKDGKDGRDGQNGTSPVLNYEDIAKHLPPITVLWVGADGKPLPGIAPFQVRLGEKLPLMHKPK